MKPGRPNSTDGSWASHLTTSLGSFFPFWKLPTQWILQLYSLNEQRDGSEWPFERSANLTISYLFVPDWKREWLPMPREFHGLSCMGWWRVRHDWATFTCSRWNSKAVAYYRYLFHWQIYLFEKYCGLKPSGFMSFQNNLHISYYENTFYMWEIVQCLCHTE